MCGHAAACVFVELKIVTPKQVEIRKQLDERGGDLEPACVFRGVAHATSAAVFTRARAEAWQGVAGRRGGMRDAAVNARARCCRQRVQRLVVASAA